MVINVIETAVAVGKRSFPYGLRGRHRRSEGELGRLVCMLLSLYLVRDAVAGGCPSDIAPENQDLIC